MSCKHPASQVDTPQPNTSLYCRACKSKVMFFTIEGTPDPVMCPDCDGKGTFGLTSTSGREVRAGCETCNRTGIRLKLIDKHKVAVVELLRTLEGRTKT